MTSQGQRARGTRAGLSVEAIVAAARSLPPEELTMQAVARVLGVDPKAINHHIGGRENLHALVARDAFATRFADVEIAAGGHWPDACRHYARGFVDSALHAVRRTGRLDFAQPGPDWGLDPAEAVVAALVQAGFTAADAQRVLVVLMDICLGHVRDVAQARAARRPRPQLLRAALERVDVTAYPTLASIAADPADTYGPTQLEVALDIFVGGVESLLASRNRGL